MIGPRAPTMLPSVMEEKWQKSLAALVGGDEAEPAGVPAARHAGRACPRGGDDRIRPARESGIGCGTRRGAIGSGCGRGGRRGNAAAAARGGVVAPVVAVVAGRVVVAGAVLGARHGGAAVGAKDLRGELSTPGDLAAAAVLAVASLFSLFCQPTDLVFFTSHRLSKPPDTAIHCPTSDRHTQTKFKLSPQPRSTPMGEPSSPLRRSDPRCGSAASPRAR